MQLNFARQTRLRLVFWRVASYKATVVGTSSLAAEREAYQRQAFAGRAAGRKTARTGYQRWIGASRGHGYGHGRGGRAAGAGQSSLPTEVYQRADIVKPRNLLGWAKDIPVEDMESLLLTNIAVTEDSMRELALQRGIAVKDYLSSRQLPVERLFLGAVKPADADPQWSPGAELNLANN